MEPPIGTWMRPADLLHLLCRWNLRRATTFDNHFGLFAPAKGTPHSKEIPQTPVLPRLLRIKVAAQFNVEVAMIAKSRRYLL
ncbi:hypothetical protein Lal_00042262 [Lupinus albus]|nr:hypothetical protein Lal_00042262 [Lupinus albus]